MDPTLLTPPGLGSSVQVFLVGRQCTHISAEIEHTLVIVSLVGLKGKDLSGFANAVLQMFHFTRAGCGLDRVRNRKPRKGPGVGG